MWILFILVLLNGQADYRLLPFKSEKECVAAKAEVSAKLASGLPTAKASLTCFHADEPGELT